MSPLRAIVAAAATVAAWGIAAAEPLQPAGPHPAPTLAASAARSLRDADVPSAQSDPQTLKARADADLARRGATPGAGPRLQAQRENLKGRDAAAELARRHDPSTYDRDIATGDIDHTQQAADLKISVKH
jgi:hypothetical protein